MVFEKCKSRWARHRSSPQVSLRRSTAGRTPVLGKVILDVVQRTLHDIAARLHEELPLLRREFSVASLGVFGSYVSGEATLASDVDVLVEFEKAPSMFEFIALENHLSDILGLQVDLVMREALKPALGPRILAQTVSV